MEVGYTLSLSLSRSLSLSCSLFLSVSLSVPFSLDPVARVCAPELASRGHQAEGVGKGRPRLPLQQRREP